MKAMMECEGALKTSARFNGSENIDLLVNDSNNENESYRNISLKRRESEA